MVRQMFERFRIWTAPVILFAVVLTAGSREIRVRGLPRGSSLRITPSWTRSSTPNKAANVRGTTCRRKRKSPWKTLRRICTFVSALPFREDPGRPAFHRGRATPPPVSCGIHTGGLDGPAFRPGRFHLRSENTAPSSILRTACIRPLGPASRLPERTRGIPRDFSLRSR